MKEIYQKVFSSGIVTVVPLVATPTPIEVVTLADVSVDFSQTTKELRGENRFPDDIALGECKISGKAKSGRVHGGLLGAVLQGMTCKAGQVAAVFDERHAVPDSPCKITVDQSAHFVEDLGLIDVTSGVAMTLTQGTPASGQYSVDEGTYTFSPDDKGHVVSFRYSYTLPTGVTWSLNNGLMGAGMTKFKLYLFNSYDGAASGIKLYSVLFPKLSMAFKTGDYMEQNLDFEACADSAGRVVDFFKA